MVQGSLFSQIYIIFAQYMTRVKSKIVIKNKRASFEYEFIDSFTAGIVLTGTEIKSIRAGKASLADSYCYFVNGELYVKNMHVADYWWGSFNQHDPRRDRKLLLNKKELRKLFRATREKGLTIVATRLFISEKGYAKLNISLAKGKREYDKRHTIKEKDLRREADRNL
jgi:SsrA-binding protein